MSKKRTLIVVSLVGATGLLLAGRLYLNRELSPVGSGVSYFRVETGDTIETVLARMERQRLVRSATAIMMHHRIFRKRGSLSAGVYEIDRAKSGDQILIHLLTTKPTRRMILIRPGLWTSQILDLLAGSDVGSPAELRAELNRPKDYADALGFEPATKSLDGYLFPDTYDFPPTTSAREAFRSMCKAFRSKFWDRHRDLSPSKVQEVVIIASLVEKEAKHDEEKPTIAGVIVNRLTKNMRLQIDATVTFALGEERRLFFNDYEIQHPYNTYRIAGLPPGPICSPGLASLEAAVRPQSHGFLFYVAKPDGFHLFSKTFQEHSANIQKLRAGK